MIVAATRETTAALVDPCSSPRREARSHAFCARDAARRPARGSCGARIRRRRRTAICLASPAAAHAGTSARCQTWRPDDVPAVAELLRARLRRVSQAFAPFAPCTARADEWLDYTHSLCRVQAAARSCPAASFVLDVPAMAPVPAGRTISTAP